MGGWQMCFEDSIFSMKKFLIPLSHLTDLLPFMAKLLRSSLFPPETTPLQAFASTG